ncbi:MAG: hypothetical protein PT958_07995 [Firmicutes bacterium]|nr:hypothetical protein [Bacillota bacterium]
MVIFPFPGVHTPRFFFAQICYALIKHQKAFAPAAHRFAALLFYGRRNAGVCCFAQPCHALRGEPQHMQQKFSFLPPIIQDSAAERKGRFPEKRPAAKTGCRRRGSR